MPYKLTLYFFFIIINYNKLLLIARDIKNQVKYVTHVKVWTQIKYNCPQLSSSSDLFSDLFITSK